MASSAVLELALMLQAVAGVADPAQRFMPVPAPAPLTDPCRDRGPVGRWVRLSADGAPKSLHDAGWLDSASIWNGSQMVIAQRRDGKWTGTAFDPCANAWAPIAETNEPPPGAPWPFPDGQDRPFRPSYDGSSFNAFDKISVWDFARKAWLAVTAKAGLSPRSHYAVALAGRRFFVWGGWGKGFSVLGDGAVLDLGRKSWKKMSAAGAPSPRLEPAAVVWTGSRLLIWGGRTGTNVPSSAHALGDGALYDPVADRWKAMSAEHAPAPRTGGTVVWTGRKLVVFGGAGDVSGPQQHDGGIYDPAADRWATLDPPPGDVALPHGNVGPLTRIIVAPDGRVVFLPDNIDRVAVLDADRASWSIVDAAELGKRNGYRAFLVGRRLIIWGGSTVVAEHICPPPIPGQPICDSWAETAPHHDGWMIVLPK
ncbi:MAG TPA: hypothetical protein VKQ32_26330 [Polyangia bacterium]|nr:hypothetical protein [Polyangia bacterium]